MTDMLSKRGKKGSFYFPESMMSEILSEANRTDRSISWVMQQVWRIARSRMRRMPDGVSKRDREL